MANVVVRSSTPVQSAAASMNSVAQQIAAMKEIQQANNAWSAEQANIQREWQEKQNAKAMDFNSSEAAKNRDWQQMLSNTAHQREIADLKAAGLNPVLSAMNGNGASVGSGATASGVTSAGAKGDTDTSLNGAIVNLLGSLYNANTQLQAANINARTQEAIADKYTAMEKIVAQIGAVASMYGSDRSASSSRFGSMIGYKGKVLDNKTSTANSWRSVAGGALGDVLDFFASRYSANSARSASKYASDTNWDIAKAFGHGQLSGLAGFLTENGLSLFGKTLRGR